MDEGSETSTIGSESFKSTASFSPTGPSLTRDPGLPGRGPPSTSSPETYLATPKPNGRSCSVQTDLAFGTELYFPFFSPKTCMELLPTLTPDQIKHELEYHIALGGDIALSEGVQTRGSSKDQERRHLRILERQLTKEITHDFKRFSQNLTKCKLITSHFSEQLEEANECIKMLRTERSNVETVVGVSEDQTTPLNPPPPPPPLFSFI